MCSHNQCVESSGAPLIPGCPPTPGCPMNQTTCTNPVKNLTSCCLPIEICNSNGTTHETQCIPQKVCTEQSCTYPNGTLNCCSEHSQCVTSGPNTGVCAISSWGPSPCVTPYQVCVTDPIKQTADCCAPGFACTPGGCVQGDCAEGHTACTRLDGTVNCCDEMSTCIDDAYSGFQGECFSGFAGDQSCLAKGNTNDVDGFVCVLDAQAQSAVCCKNGQTCTPNGCTGP